MRLVLLVFALVVGPWAAGQEKPPPDEPSRSEEPPPPPTVTVSPVGIVVISGASKEEPAPEAAEKGDKPEAEAKVDEDATAEKAPEEAGAEAEPETLTPPKSSTVTKRGYDLGGRATLGAITISGHGTDTTRSTTRRLRNSSGRDVPYLTESEQVLSRTTAGRVTERRTHRYDTAGNAVSQQLVRNEERLLPDGSVQRIATVYESDVNGRMQPTEQGEGSARITTTRHVDNGAGRMIESEREESTLTRSGNVATTSVVAATAASPASGLGERRRHQGGRSARRASTRDSMVAQGRSARNAALSSLADVERAAQSVQPATWRVVVSSASPATRRAMACSPQQPGGVPGSPRRPRSLWVSVMTHPQQRPARPAPLRGSSVSAP